MPTWKPYATKADVLATKLDAFATPDDGVALNASNVRHGLLLKLIDDTTKFLRSDGGWQVPAGAGALATSGTYTGNGAANRAIAHGLGTTPKLVVILGEASTYATRKGFIDAGYAKEHDFAGTERSVTAMDATNFYVDAFYFNLSPIVYNWIALT